MTEERARQIIQMLDAVEGWRERPDWSGLVEQQAIFPQGAQAMIHLPGVLAGAGEVQSFCQRQGWRFCFIGGVAAY
jgi:hypothetical protein